MLFFFFFLCADVKTRLCVCTGTHTRVIFPQSDSNDGEKGLKKVEHKASPREVSRHSGYHRYHYWVPALLSHSGYSLEFIALLRP